MSAVEEFKTALLNNRLIAAAATLYFYDKVLVCQQEIALIWARTNTGAVVRTLYGTMHVCTALYLLMTICTPSNTSCEMSLALNVVADATTCALYLSWGMTSVLRVYAINGRQPTLPALVLVFALVLPIAANLYNAASLKRMTPPGSDTCGYYTTTPVRIRDIIEITTRTSSSVADALVLYATWRVTGNLRKLARRLDVDVSFASLVLADGTLYFCVLLITNVVVLALYIPNLHNGNMPSEATVLATVLTTVFLSRLLLNLRDGVRPSHTNSETAEMTTLDFSGELRPLGSPADDGLSWDHDDEEEEARNELDLLESNTLEVLEQEALRAA